MEKRLNVWVSEGLLRRTKAQAALGGHTLKRMVTLALEEFLDNKEMGTVAHKIPSGGMPNDKAG